VRNKTWKKLQLALHHKNMQDLTNNNLNATALMHVPHYLLNQLKDSLLFS
jgi:hypothetical protein